MKLISYESLGELKFNDTFDDIKLKLKEYKIIVDDKDFLGIVKKTIYVSNLKLYIVFTEDEKSVEYFEAEDSIIHNGNDLFNTGYGELLSVYRSLDTDIEIDDEGFKSTKFGFSIGLEFANGTQSESPKSVIVFGRKYNKKTQDELKEDILKYLMD